MTVLKLDGMVGFRDVPYPAYGAGTGLTALVPFIGDLNLIDGVQRAFPRGSKVTVAISDGQYVGDLVYDYGSPGFGEYTPGDPAELFLMNPEGSADAWMPSRGHDLLSRIEELEGMEITIWFADEPFNVLDVS